MLRTGPQGLRPAFLWLWVAGLNRLRKKSILDAQPLEGRLIFDGHTVSLKRYPDTKPEFSAACEAVPFPEPITNQFWPWETRLAASLLEGIAWD
jgi:hypothetical protein